MIHLKFTDGNPINPRSQDVGNESTILVAWDTPGEERYLSHGLKKVKLAHIVLVVYDVTSEESFVKADEWIDIAKESARDSAVIVLVANKADKSAEQQVRVGGCM